MLAREYCDDIDRKEKPVIISHHMLLGLKEGFTKMSKSVPDSAIFMEDTREDVVRKIKKGYCPEKQVEDNPILDYCKSIIIPAQGSITVVRKPDNGGTKVFSSYEELEAEFVSGDVHPGDLKPSVASALNDLIQPVRDHFAKDPYARKLLEIITGWNKDIDAKKAAAAKSAGKK
jgi:tyrosyl-tRNA synthetase